MADEFTDLWKLTFDPAQSGRQAQQQLTAALIGNLALVPQADRIPKERRRQWADATVHAGMLAISRSMGMPDSLGSSWNVTPPSWWKIAAGLVANECSAMSRLRPDELAALAMISRGQDSPQGLTAKLIAARRLCLAPASSLTPAGWRALGRRRWMQECWRGGDGLSANDGWSHDQAAIRRIGEFAGHHGFHPQEPSLPGLMRQRIGNRADRSCPLVLVEYLWPGADNTGLAAGQLNDAHHVLLSLQVMLAVRAGLHPQDAGFVIFDAERMRWRWRRAKWSATISREAEEAGGRLWREHIQAGELPESTVGDPAEADQAMDPQDPQLVQQLVECWAVSLLGDAVNAAAGTRRGKLLEMIDRLAGDRTPAVSAGDLCSLSTYRQWQEGVLTERLGEAGIDHRLFRRGGKAPDAERLREAVDQLAGNVMSGSLEAGEMILQLQHLSANPPQQDGRLDCGAAADALRKAGGSIDGLQRRVIKISGGGGSACQELECEAERLIDEVSGSIIERAERKMPDPDFAPEDTAER